LRHVTYPSGVSAVDQTIIYLLTKCCKVRAVAGPAGKVLQVRSFIQNTYGYNKVDGDQPEHTVDQLINHIVTKMKGTSFHLLTCNWYHCSLTVFAMTFVLFDHDSCVLDVQHFLAGGLKSNEN